MSKPLRDYLEKRERDLEARIERLLNELLAANKRIWELENELSKVAQKRNIK